ncbi:MAG: hypothetical protein Ctma_0643 [Catillopecten margaritatus gill symbiont]|uniref:LicD/FKTN/FKRP nucleotidyltransferase domain-containing protein n=1 Tax=Catillopecten margaritatus gill symbiont TaxID=3083288 RepID=A0AAU6PFZ1_9GAMM
MYNNFLKPATLKDLQAELLGLLKIIDKVCRENNIEYWLHAGTLLGAVRHGGYIPWDDDIDICVPAGDYQRLISALDAESKVNKNIFLYFEHATKPKSAHLRFEKLATTKMVMQRGKKVFSCYVDIFPSRIINKADKEKDQNIANIIGIFSSSVTLNDAKIDSKYIKNTLKSALVEKQRFTQYFHSEYLPNCNDRAADSLVMTDDIYYPYADIFPLQEMNFEGLKCLVPNNVENYLSADFGDYMTLPPKSERVPKHSGLLYFCNSNQFALESTTATLSKEMQSFYRHPIQRYFKKLIKNFTIYNKMKNWDKNRRARKYVKKSH